MNGISVGRFVLVHALIAGLLSLCVRTATFAAPVPAPDDPPSWPQEDDIIRLEDVLINPVVSPTTAAELLFALGVPLSPTADVGLTAEGDLPSGGQFSVFVDGSPTGASVRLMARTKTDISLVQHQHLDENGDALADFSVAVSLASATLSYGSIAVPVVCAINRLVAQPLQEGAQSSRVTSICLLGQAVNAVTATAFVRQVQAWTTAVMMEQGGGITPPTPPNPPGVIVPCWAPCSDLATLGQAACGAAFAACIAAVIVAQLFSSAGLCVFGCLLLGPLAPLCLQGCMALVSGALAVGYAGCVGALVTCEIGVAVSVAACVALHCP